MAYCSNCGVELPADANFCSRCGWVTPVGAASGADEPWASVRAAFVAAGQEMEKTFHTVGKELESAFSRAEKDVRQPRSGAAPTACSYCGAQNPATANFCRSCGKKIAHSNQ